ncbi:MAG TPA: hypothetical protein VGM76_17010, partial [Lacipirellulaceae bacterium]
MIDGVFRASVSLNLVCGPSLVDFAPEIGEFDYHFGQPGRLIAVVGRRIDDEPATFVNQKLDVLNLGINDPILGDAMAGLELKFFHTIPTGSAGDDFNHQVRWTFDPIFYDPTPRFADIQQIR